MLKTTWLNTNAFILANDSVRLNRQVRGSLSQACHKILLGQSLTLLACIVCLQVSRHLWQRAMSLILRLLFIRQTEQVTFELGFYGCFSLHNLSSSAHRSLIKLDFLCIFQTEATFVFTCAVLRQVFNCIAIVIGLLLFHQSFHAALAL